MNGTLHLAIALTELFWINAHSSFYQMISQMVFPFWQNAGFLSLLFLCCISCFPTQCGMCNSVASWWRRQADQHLVLSTLVSFLLSAFTAGFLLQRVSGSMAGKLVVLFIVPGETRGGLCGKIPFLHRTPEGNFWAGALPLGGRAIALGALQPKIVVSKLEFGYVPGITSLVQTWLTIPPESLYIEPLMISKLCSGQLHLPEIPAQSLPGC